MLAHARCTAYIPRMNRKELSYIWIILIALLAFAVASCSGEEGEADATGGDETDAISQAPEAAGDAQATDEETADGQDDGASADEEPAEEVPFATTEAIGMTLAWRVAGEDLEIELTGPTTGWIAVGFNPSRAMKDANILIGYVDGADVVMTDQFGTTMISHRRDDELGGTSDATVVSGSEAGGETRIRVTIPLDSARGDDRPLGAGETVRAILAYGPDGADDTQTYHENRAGLDIEL